MPFIQLKTHKNAKLESFSYIYSSYFINSIRRIVIECFFLQKKVFFVPTMKDSVSVCRCA